MKKNIIIILMAVMLAIGTHTEIYAKHVQGAQVGGNASQDIFEEGGGGNSSGSSDNNTSSNSSSNSGNGSSGGILSDILDFGSNLNGNGGQLGDELAGFITNKVQGAVELIGNLIFVAVTVILGVKYIWSSAEGKAEVQESLPGFVLAVVFFYAAGSLVNLFMGTTSTTGIFEAIGGATTWGEAAGLVMYAITTVVKYVAFAGLVFMGVKYLIASAEGRASMKTNMGGMVIGVIFTFLATNVITFFATAGRQILQ